HLRVLRYGRAVADRHPLEAGCLQQILQRVGMHRAYVREIAEVAAEKGEPAGRVDRLEHDRRARTQLLERGREQANEIRRLEMLDDLRREQPAKRRLPLRSHIRERVTL